MCDQVKHRSALMDRFKNISIYNGKLKSINSKLSMVARTSDFI